MYCFGSPANRFYHLIANLHGDFAASCGEGLSHTSKVGMQGSRRSKMATPHSDFGLHDARVVPLQSPILRDDTFFIIASTLLGNLFRCRPFLFAQFASRCQLSSRSFPITSMSPARQPAGVLHPISLCSRSVSSSVTYPAMRFWACSRTLR